MSCDAAIRAYCQEVEQRLDLPPRQRRALLAGLRQELDERFASAPELTVEDLRRQVGPPEEVMSTLMEGVDPEEQALYRTRKKRRTRALIVALAAVLVVAVCLVIHMWSNGGLVVIETTHYMDGIPEGFPTDGVFQEVYHYNNEEA